MSDEERFLAPNLLLQEIRTATRWKAWLILAAVLAALGFLGWAAWPAHPVKEVVTAAPEERQVDQSVVAERVPPAAHPTKAPHIIPKGAHEERRGQIVAAPALGASSVEVDYSLARMPDGGRRVIVSSPDGTVQHATDMVIEPDLVAPPEKPWAAGVSYGTNRSIGLWVDRDIGGRLRVGAAVQRLENGKAEAQLRVGVRF